MDPKLIDGTLRPKSIAVVGASATPGKIGYTVLENLIKGGYEGKIFPINPGATEILGLKVYPSVNDVKDPIDAAIVTVPAKLVPEVADAMKALGLHT